MAPAWLWTRTRLTWRASNNLSFLLDSTPSDGLNLFEFRVISAGQPGVDNGIRLNLIVNRKEYLSSFMTPFVGFHVAIHPQDEIPVISRMAFAISPGMATHVILEVMREFHIKEMNVEKCQIFNVSKFVRRSFRLPFLRTADRVGNQGIVNLLEI